MKVFKEQTPSPKGGLTLTHITFIVHLVNYCSPAPYTGCVGHMTTPLL